MEKRFLIFKKKVNGNKEISKIPQTQIEKRKAEADKQNKSTWTKITKFSQKRAAFIIIGIIVLAVPISIQVLNLETSLDLKLAIPRETEVWDSYGILGESFPAGQLDRHYVVIQTNETDGISDAEFYTNVQNLIVNLIENTSIEVDSFTGICWASGSPIPWPRSWARSPGRASGRRAASG